MKITTNLIILIIAVGIAFWSGYKYGLSVADFPPNSKYKIGQEVWHLFVNEINKATVLGLAQPRAGGEVFYYLSGSSMSGSTMWSTPEREIFKSKEELLKSL